MPARRRHLPDPCHKAVNSSCALFSAVIPPRRCRYSFLRRSERKSQTTMN
jgi:hypothetical protein